MKNVIILIISLFLFQVVFGNEAVNDTYVKEKTYNANLSLGLVNGGSIGCGKIKYTEKSVVEFTLNVHYHTCHYFYNTGIYTQYNIFKNKHRQGFFYVLTGGLDYTEGESIFRYNMVDNNDDEDRKYEGLFPNIAIGIGYSFAINEESSWRIFWDIGVKKSITNLNISINF